MSFLGCAPWPVVFCILTERQHGSLSFNLCHGPACWAPARVQRSHLWGMCVEGGTQFGGPSLTQYVRQQISLFSPLLTAQVPTLYPRKCCQGRWARVMVREPRVMCGCSVCLDKCVVSKACLIILLLLLFFFLQVLLPLLLLGDPCILCTCVRASACMCECFHMSRQEWNPRGPTRLDSGY